MEQPVFYYDLGLPQCYLMAERIMSALPVAAEWEPVSGAQLGTKLEQPNVEELEAAVESAGLQPLRWPEKWPPDARRAMLAATYAKRIGRAVAFSLAAFRQAFAAGRDLGEDDTLLIAGAACEMHPSALLKGMALRSVSESLEVAGERASSAGVRSLPAVQIGGEVFEGPDGLDRAKLALAA